MEVLPFLLLLLQLVSSRVTYHTYIRPTLDSPCPYGDCLTLTEYARQTTSYSYPDNLTLVFLPGEHVLNSSIVFQQLESLSLLGNLSSLPSITSKVVCNNTSAFILKSISYLEIKALAFNSCGRLGDTEIPCTIPTLYYNIDMVWVPEVLPAISALLVQNFHLASCQFKHNFLPLLLNHSESYIGNSEFVANMGCLGGAILAHVSNITLQEQNSFTDNFAMMGGGIFAGNSKVMITGTASFHANNASYGGGMGMVYSTLTFDSTAHKFEKPINKTQNCPGNMLLYNNT